jgi:hypothetical protein
MRHIRSHVLIGIDANSIMAGAKMVKDALVNEIDKKAYRKRYR